MTRARIERGDRRAYVGRAGDDLADRPRLESGATNPDDRVAFFEHVRRAAFPHPLTLLTACILAAALASYVLPAGQYERRDDPVTGRAVVVAGTYHLVERAPVSPFQALVAIPKGLAAAGSVVFLVFLVGGAFTVVEETGALRQAVSWLVRRLQSRETLVTRQRDEAAKMKEAWRRAPWPERGQRPPRGQDRRRDDERQREEERQRRERQREPRSRGRSR